MNSAEGIVCPNCIPSCAGCQQPLSGAIMTAGMWGSGYWVRKKIRFFDRAPGSFDVDGGVAFGFVAVAEVSGPVALHVDSENTVSDR